MGDYNKLIVSCTVKGITKKQLEDEIVDLCLGDSAYQSQETIVSIEPNTWSSKTECLDIVLVGQTSEWLKQHVVQGSGKNDVYAMSFSEYGDTPQIWKLTDYKEYE